MLLWMNINCFLLCIALPVQIALCGRICRAGSCGIPKGCSPFGGMQGQSLCLGVQRAGSPLTEIAKHMTEGPVDLSPDVEHFCVFRMQG